MHTFTVIRQNHVVNADSPERTAVWEAFLYQRAHIDAFKVALTPLRDWQGESRRHVGILDFGCGAGTTAFAFDEFCQQGTRLSYRGVDHNEPSVDLCAAMARDLVLSSGGTFEAAKASDVDLGAVAEPLAGTDRFFLTFGYALCQPAVTDQVVTHIASEITRMAQSLGPVRVVIADAPLSTCRARQLITLLHARASDVRERVGEVLKYDIRFPALDGEEFRRTLYGRRTQVHYVIVT